MLQNLLAAFCLALVLEGLYLFVAPNSWKKMAEQMLSLPNAQIRQLGAIILVLGVIALWWVRA